MIRGVISGELRPCSAQSGGWWEEPCHRMREGPASLFGGSGICPSPRALAPPTRAPVHCLSVTEGETQASTAPSPITVCSESLSPVQKHSTGPPWLQPQTLLLVGPGPGVFNCNSWARSSSTIPLEFMRKYKFCVSTSELLSHNLWSGGLPWRSSG